ncbi:MAG: hypothetical protein KKG64_02285 [Firmicutes bacterium]|nr:hypothetical protein [Bacillota bacterium]
MSEQEIITRLNDLVSPELKQNKRMKASELTSINNLVDALHLFCYSTNDKSIYKFVKLLDSEHHIEHKVSRDFVIELKEGFI